MTKYREKFWTFVLRIGMDRLLTWSIQTHSQTSDWIYRSTNASMNSNWPKTWVEPFRSLFCPKVRKLTSLNVAMRTKTFVDFIVYNSMMNDFIGTRCVLWHSDQGHEWQFTHLVSKKHSLTRLHNYYEFFLHLRSSCICSAS